MKKKTQAAIKAAAILEQHLSTLPPAKSRKARTELDKLAISVSRHGRITANELGDILLNAWKKLPVKAQGRTLKRIQNIEIAKPNRA